jgi:oxygen-dependent protoporphyrinogen oxidase
MRRHSYRSTIDLRLLIGLTSLPSFPTRSVAVLGAGITGLAAAWHLHRAGIPTTLFEASSRCGGAIDTIREGGWLHETGPNSLLEDDETAALIEAVGLGGERIYPGEVAKHRYVLKSGRLEPVPGSPGEFLRTRLFSLRAKLGLAGEVFRSRRRSDDDETVAKFTERRLGREFLDYAVDPFVGGVYAGDPAKLSLRHAFPRLFALERDHGSLIRGAIKLRNSGGGPRGKILSFPAGLQALPLFLAVPLARSLKFNTRVVAVRRVEQGWRIAFEQNGETRWGAFSGVISALPAGSLARIRFEGCPAADGLSLLGEIEHPPVASVFTGFRREDVSHPLDGFGMLIPKAEGRTILGTLFSSTLFPGRAPAGHVALTTFVGGARQPELGRLDNQALAKLVQAELAALLGVRAAPVYVSVRRHPQAIPQYNVGFDRYKAACTQAEAASPGLFIGGNGRDGVSIPACLASGRRLALAAASHPTAAPI